jgi:hypothetical protein
VLGRDSRGALVAAPPPGGVAAAADRGAAEARRLKLEVARRNLELDAFLAELLAPYRRRRWDEEPVPGAADERAEPEAARRPVTSPAISSLLLLEPPPPLEAAPRARTTPRTSRAR